MQNKFSKIKFKKFLDKNPSRVFEGGKRFENKANLYDHLGPKITIITVIKNKADYVEETILSIKNQNYKNIEYIVIDGVSTDGSIDIIKKYMDNIDYFVSEPDDGNYDAINKGISLSTGDLIGIVNADDILLEDATEILLKYYNKYSNCDFFFGSVKKHWGILSGYKPYKIKYSWFFYTSHSTGFFIKRKAAEKNGKYSLKYKYSSDFDLFYRMIVKHKMNGTGTKKDEIFGNFRSGGFSSKVSFKDHFKEGIKIRLDNGQNKIIVGLIIFLKFIKNIRKFL